MLRRRNVMVGIGEISGIDGSGGGEKIEEKATSIVKEENTME